MELLSNDVPISVIIPCYLSNHTVARAIESVWNQTWRPKEVILIDDCSPDNGLSVEKLYEIKNNYKSNWIKVVPLKKNLGPGGARNKGWDLATETYIAFLDADDSWHPQKIEIQLGLLYKHPNAMILGHKCEVLKDISDKNKTIGNIKLKKVTKLDLLHSNKYFLTPSVIIKRDIKFRFNNKRYSEDFLLWLEIILSNHKGYYINNTLGYLYKDYYGESGISSNIYKMEIGELKTYHKIWKDRYISIFMLVWLFFWSIMKFLRRYIKTKVKSFFL